MWNFHSLTGYRKNRILTTVRITLKNQSINHRIKELQGLEGIKSNFSDKAHPYIVLQVPYSMFFLIVVQYEKPHFTSGWKDDLSYFKYSLTET